MSFRQTSVSGFPAVALRSALIELVAVPAIGMKLTNLRRLNGREWLWRNDQIPLAPPRPGASYVETADNPVSVPQVGVWINCRGWAPTGRTPYYNLALEPCIGAPDRLDLAALEWKTAQTLHPGDERRWSVDVRVLDD